MQSPPVAALQIGLCSRNAVLDDVFVEPALRRIEAVVLIGPGHQIAVNEFTISDRAVEIQLRQGYGDCGNGSIEFNRLVQANSTFKITIPLIAGGVVTKMHGQRQGFHYLWSSTQQNGNSVGTFGCQFNVDKLWVNGI